MKTLGFAVGGTPIQLPGQINTAYNNSGAFGENVIQLGIDVLIFAAVFLTFGFVLYGGWKWMTSQGDKKAISEARDTIIWSVVGIMVVLLAFLAVNVVLHFFQVPSLGK